MAEDDDTGRRRRLTIALALIAVILLAAAVSILVVRSRQPARSRAALCGQLEQAKDLDNALTSLDPATLDPQVRALGRAAQVAPSEIAGSVSELSRFIGSLLDEVDAAPPFERRRVLADALAQRQAEVDGITAAGRALQGWAAANCDLELGDVTTSSLP